MLESIKKLREQTGAGMMDVKKALADAEGNELARPELEYDPEEGGWRLSDSLIIEGDLAIGGEVDQEWSEESEPTVKIVDEESPKRH